MQAKVETSAALGPVTNEDSGMKKSRFTEEKIAYALKQAELGTAVGEICRKMGIAAATFYVWRKKYGGLGPSEFKRLRLLEEKTASSSSWLPISVWTRPCCRRWSQKSSEACPATHLGWAVARALWGQHAAGIADGDDVVFQLFVQGQGKGQPGGTNAHA